MSASCPPPVARKPSGIRVMIGNPGEALPTGIMPVYTSLQKANGDSGELKHTSTLNAEREVDLLNHCFDDMERFMGRLQQTAEAQSVLNQRNKKRSRKSKKKQSQDDDLLMLKASPPPQEEFVDIFQKIKYSLSLLVCFSRFEGRLPLLCPALRVCVNTNIEDKSEDADDKSTPHFTQDRLKSSISEPNSPELLHHVFVPLGLLVKTTGGPELGATVVSPALTQGAVSLLQEHLNEEEKELWTSLGPYWTLHCSQLSVSVPPYTPVFLDGWQPQASSSDPIESQHQQDVIDEENTRHTSMRPVSTVETTEEFNGLPPEGERHYCCSYDFVARNSSELSVLQGETLEVIESSKRWWKCRNRFDQIGFVPHNILEPLSALNNGERHSPMVRRESKKVPLSPPSSMYFSFPPTSPNDTSPSTGHPALRPPSMPGLSTTLQGEGDRVLMNDVNDELQHRLANGKSGSNRPLVIPRTSDTSAPLDYHSSPAQVAVWLSGKGFSQETIQLLGILSAAQIFSLNKEELRTVSPEEGARVYSQIMVQKALLEDVHKATELEAVMKKQKLKVDVKSQGGAL